MNSRRVTNAGMDATSTSPSSRRLYTTSSSALGGSSSAAEARTAQERSNAAQVALHEEKMEEKRKKKLEEKMARYSFLIGNTLGKTDGLTMQQVRQIQDERHSEIAAAAALKLRQTQDKCRKYPTESHQESGNGVTKDKAMTMREIRLQQQEAYNTVMKKKPFSKAS